jgi:hypothetical protein
VLQAHTRFTGNTWRATTCQCLSEPKLSRSTPCHTCAPACRTLPHAELTYLVSIACRQHSGPVCLPGWLHSLDREPLCRLPLQPLEVNLGALGLIRNCDREQESSSSKRVGQSAGQEASQEDMSETLASMRRHSNVTSRFGEREICHRGRAFGNHS